MTALATRPESYSLPFERRTSLAADAMPGRLPDLNPSMPYADGAAHLDWLGPIDPATMRPLRVQVSGLPGGTHRVTVGWYSLEAGLAVMACRQPVTPFVRDADGAPSAYSYAVPDVDLFAAALRAAGLGFHIYADTSRGEDYDDRIMRAELRR